MRYVVSRSTEYSRNRSLKRLRDLKELRPNVRATVQAALETHLRHEPRKTSRSRIKRLRGLARPQYRLRVGEVRIFYHVAEAMVEMLAIVSGAALLIR